MNLTLDPTDTRTLPVQIAAAVRDQVARGLLRPGEPVASTRALSSQLGLSRGTVVTAYDQLLAEGYLVSEVGSGTRVNPRLQAPIPAVREVPAPAPQHPARLNLTPGLPDTRTLITPEWRSAWRLAASHVLADAPSAGLPALRAEVASHLRHMRGLVVDPARIIITAGAREGLSLLLRVMAGTRRLRIGVESPGYPSLRKIPAALGHELIEVPTDSEGVTVPAGVGAPAGSLDALIVTPSHQYPFGDSLSAARRTQLVAWARETGAWLIEDDFDSELRYVGQPLPALSSLEPARTTLLGTFSSVISPTIACGYLVVPPDLLDALSSERALFGQPVSLITQTALANYLASGALRRHTGSMRRAYKRRRDIVSAALGNIPGTQLLPIRGGLHAVLLCESPVEDIVQRAAEAGIGLTALADYWGGEDAPNGIVLGFGHLTDADLNDALAHVTAATESLAAEDNCPHQ